MKRILTLIALAALVCGTANRSQAVELLISGNFEPPTGEFGKVPGWELQEFLTGSSEEITTASLTGGTDIQLFLHAFAGGGPLTPLQGNFNNDGLPAGNVDGRDFLIWQRNFGRTDALPADGDATGDMVVDGNDLAIWQSNYGASPAGRFANAVLRQAVPAAAGETYTFQGTSTFEEFYSGFVTTLGDASPHGQIASPTTTQFKMEFLNSSGNVIGSPTTLDLRPEQTFPGFPIVHTPLVAVAPAGTVNVRVVAEALNMAWNGTTTSAGLAQSAYFNDFSLTSATNPGNQLLANADLNLEIPTALDFWNQVETPAEKTDILRAGPQFGFANHTPGGTAGVWLSAFLGGSTVFATPNTDPVDGVISQTVEAVAGGTYTFSGWTKFEANYAGGVDTIAADAPVSALFKGMTSPTETEIKLEFLDINSNVISSSVIDVREERQAACAGGNANSGTCGPAANGWLQHTLQAVAPANTIFARLTAQMIDGVFNKDPGQSAFFDDFSLDGPAPGLVANSAVPEPTSMALVAFGLAAMGLRRGGRKS